MHRRIPNRERVGGDISPHIQLVKTIGKIGNICLEVQLQLIGTGQCDGNAVAKAWVLVVEVFYPHNTLAGQVLLAQQAEHKPSKR